MKTILVLVLMLLPVSAFAFGSLRNQTCQQAQALVNQEFARSGIDRAIHYVFFFPEYIYRTEDAARTEGSYKTACEQHNCNPEPYSVRTQDESTCFVGFSCVMEGGPNACTS